MNYVTQLSAFQPPHRLKASHGGFLCFKGRTFFNSANLMTSSNHKMDWNNTSYLNYGHNVTFHFDYILTWFNDYFAAYKKVNGSRSDGFQPDVYQIWDEVIWLTLEKGCLLFNVPICQEQTEPSPEVRQLKGKGKVGHVGTCPGREPQTSPGGGPTTKPSNQEADTEPLDTAETRAFFLIWEAGRSYKTCPHPSYLADSLCLLAHPPREFCPRATAQ